MIGWFLEEHRNVHRKKLKPHFIYGPQPYNTGGSIPSPRMISCCWVNPSFRRFNSKNFVSVKCFLTVLILLRSLKKNILFHQLTSMNPQKNPPNKPYPSSIKNVKTVKRKFNKNLIKTNKFLMEIKVKTKRLTPTRGLDGSKPRQNKRKTSEKMLLKSNKFSFKIIVKLNINKIKPTFSQCYPSFRGSQRVSEKPQSNKKIPDKINVNKIKLTFNLILTKSASRNPKRSSKGNSHNSVKIKIIYKISDKIKFNKIKLTVAMKMVIILLKPVKWSAGRPTKGNPHIIRASRAMIKNCEKLYINKIKFTVAKIRLKTVQRASKWMTERTTIGNTGKMKNSQIVKIKSNIIIDKNKNINKINLTRARDIIVVKNLKSNKLQTAEKSIYKLNSNEVKNTKRNKYFPFCLTIIKSIKLNGQFGILI